MISLFYFHQLSKPLGHFKWRKTLGEQVSILICLTDPIYLPIPIAQKYFAFGLPVKFKCVYYALFKGKWVAINKKRFMFNRRNSVTAKEKIQWPDKLLLPVVVHKPNAPFVSITSIAEYPTRIPLRPCNLIAIACSGSSNYALNTKWSSTILECLSNEL